jgi:hypothetical protein
MAAPEHHQRAVSIIDRPREYLRQLNMPPHSLDEQPAGWRVNNSFDAQKLVAVRVQQRR